MFTLLKENTGIKNAGRFWDRVSSGMNMVKDINENPDHY